MIIIYKKMIYLIETWRLS